MSLYPMTIERRSRLLCVFAHPDDEVFCAGGTLARWVESGGEAMVISATRGEAGQIQDARAATRGTLGAVRERELRASCARLGVQWVECLDYADGTLADVSVGTLARDLAARMGEFKPDVVITFGPDGGYGHPDHIAISAATTLACHLVARGGGRAPHLYYSAFPAQHRLLCRSLAQWLTERGSAFRGAPAFTRALALLAEEATLLRYADDTVETLWFPVGFSILEPAEAVTGLYLIVSGHVEVTWENGGGSGQGRQRLGPGQFFGHWSLARNEPGAESVVATDTVTCLVLSSRAATAFDGRGAGAFLGSGPLGARQDDHACDGLMGVDVAAHLDRKAAALAAHRTQFAIETEMLPRSLLLDLLGDEYFERVVIASVAGARHAGADYGAAALWSDPVELVAVPA